MKAFVDHRLGEVERRHTSVFQPGVVEQGFVHARPFRERHAHQVAQRRLDIVGVQHRVLRDLLEAVRTVAQHIGQGADIHTHLPVEGAHPAEIGF